ncbi:hypothetical protein LEP3755_26820 [Leptolyngbya sp. NIES-3755]|nr:hypothetical protein LEP3755_26820 [Leptolyngbya sp. NIES-3755]
MTTYRLSPRFFSRYRQRMSLLMGSAIFGVLVYSFADRINRYPPVVIISSIIFMVLIAGISLPLILRGEFKKHQRIWSSYELTLSEDSIARTQDGYERVQISRSEITRIIEVTDYGLTIVGTNNAQIFVPRLVENYVLLRNLLAEWRSIEVQALWRNLTLCFTIAFLPWGLIYGIARIFQNKFLTAGSLTIYLAYIVYSMSTLVRSGDVNREEKQNILRALGGFSALIISVIVLLIIR